MMSIKKVIASFSLSSLCVSLAYFAPVALAVEQSEAVDKSGCSQAQNFEKQDGLSGWPKRVENSEDEGLRKAFKEGTCVWLKGEHLGGDKPSNAPDKIHVTVTYSPDGRTNKVCHVFKKMSTARQGSGFPTTCR